MAKYIGMNEEALRVFGFAPIGTTRDGATIWSTLYCGSLIKTVCGVAVETI